MCSENKQSLAADCPCIQVSCDIHGNCVECVREHRRHQEHLPECMQPILRGLVKDLALKVELKTVEGRPEPSS